MVSSMSSVEASQITHSILLLYLTLLQDSILGNLLASDRLKWYQLACTYQYKCSVRLRQTSVSEVCNDPH